MPGVVVAGADSFASIVMSPKAAAEAGAPVFDASLLASLTAKPTTDQVDAARAAVVADLPLDEYALTVERGYESPTGSACWPSPSRRRRHARAPGHRHRPRLTDARADHATLAAVGAAPGCAAGWPARRPW